jgi:metal-responsive CopG/Arc/MetJ family transcriptional regulator
MPTPLKKVLITVPEDLLNDVDDMLSHEEHLNRSELVRNLLAEYVKSSRAKEIENQLIEGYRSMGGLNVELSEFGFDAKANLEAYENYLSNSKYAT